MSLKLGVDVGGTFTDVLARVGGDRGPHDREGAVHPGGPVARGHGGREAGVRDARRGAGRPVAHPARVDRRDEHDPRGEGRGRGSADDGRPRADPPSGARVDARSAVRVDGHDQARPARAAVAHARHPRADERVRRGHHGARRGRDARGDRGPARVGDGVAHDRVPQRVRELGPRAPGAGDRAGAAPRPAGVDLLGPRLGVPRVRADAHGGAELLHAAAGHQVRRRPGVAARRRRVPRPAEHRALRRRHDERPVDEGAPGRHRVLRPVRRGGGRGLPRAPHGRAERPHASTWAGRRPTSRCAATARSPSSARRSSATTSSRPAGPTSTAWAPAAARSPTSTSRARSRSARAARAPIPGPPATAAAARSRRSPTPTSCSAGCRAGRSSAGASRSTSTPPSGPWRRSPRGWASTPSQPRRRSSTSPTRTCTPPCASCRVERGYDPRDFGLVAFGGAGPLHANALARLIGADPLIIPSTPGVLSAFGFLAADVQNEFARTYLRPAEETPGEDVLAAVDELIGEAGAWLDAEGVDAGDRVFDVFADCRYYRQDIQIPVRAGAHGAAQRVRRAAARRLRGRAPPPLRLRPRGATSRSPRCGSWAAARAATSSSRPPPPDPRRSPSTATSGCTSTASGTTRRSTSARSSRPGHVLAGPAIVEQEDSTSVIEPGWTGTVDDAGNITVRRQG